MRLAGKNRDIIQRRDQIIHDLYANAIHRAFCFVPIIFELASGLGRVARNRVQPLPLGNQRGHSFLALAHRGGERIAGFAEQFHSDALAIRHRQARECCGKLQDGRFGIAGFHAERIKNSRLGLVASSGLRERDVELLEADLQLINRASVHQHDVLKPGEAFYGHACAL